MCLLAISDEIFCKEILLTVNNKKVNQKLKHGAKELKQPNM